MVGENLRDHQRNSPGGRNVQEFVRAMGVGMRSEHAGDDELRLRELLAEHPHERDAAALAHLGGRRPKAIWELRARDCSSQGAKAGAFQPAALDSTSKLTSAP